MKFHDDRGFDCDRDCVSLWDVPIQKIGRCQHYLQTSWGRNHPRFARARSLMLTLCTKNQRLHSRDDSIKYGWLVMTIKSMKQISWKWIINHKYKIWLQMLNWWVRRLKKFQILFNWWFCIMWFQAKAWSLSCFIFSYSEFYKNQSLDLVWEEFTTVGRHINGLVQERRNSSVLAMELHLSYTNPSTCIILTA